MTMETFSNQAILTNWSFLPPPSNTSTSSVYRCFNHRLSSFISTSFAFTSFLLLLPFCILVLFVGFRRYRRQRSTSSAMSHTDAFTYHMVTTEMVSICACALLCWGFFMEAWQMTGLGLRIISITQMGQVIFHMLTCGERYLAVVHPITYLGLKENRTGLWIRNVLLAFVWLLMFGIFGLHPLISHFHPTSSIFLLVFSLSVIVFFNFSVLHSLTHPGPGNGAGSQVNRSKRRAFHTIGAIMGVLLFRVLTNLLLVGMVTSNILSGCSFLVSGVFFSLPSSLVSPLLFLHRAGIFTCRTKNTRPAPESNT